MNTFLVGTCLCEQVSFQVAADLPNFYQCHCTKCRQVTGSANNTGTLVANEQFAWLKGQELVSHFVKETGYCSSFCSCCGSAMPNRLRDGAGYWVPAGALPECDSRVVVHLCVDNMASWDHIEDQSKCYASVPDLLLLRKLLAPESS